MFSLQDPNRPQLPAAGVAARMAVIGAVLLGSAVAFAYVGGWLSPHRLTQARIVARLQAGAGPEPGFRRNHAKGLCATGQFESNGNAAALSRAVVFQPGDVPVIGRFALAGPKAFQPDAMTTVESLALRFLPAHGEEWRTGMLNIPVFLVNTPRGFYDLLAAMAPDPATGKPDPAKMAAFIKAHPEFPPAIKIIKSGVPASGFGNATYNALEVFRFISAAGVATPVRWSAVPEQAYAPASAERAKSGDKNYLFDDLIAAERAHPQKFHLVITVGEQGDPIDPTLPWPAGRQKIDAGTVTLDAVTSEDNGTCTDVNYDPLVLPDGITPSDDPILSARSAAYAKSFLLRAGEKDSKPGSAVSTAEVDGKGKS